MCNSVCIVYRRFDKESKRFSNEVVAELKRRNIPAFTDCAFDIFNCFKRHRTYGMAIAVDFYRDGASGSGVTINRNCNQIGREFICNLSNEIDRLMPEVIWRSFDIVNSYNRDWFKFYNKISARVKAIFYLCTRTNSVDFDIYKAHQDEVVTLFVDEIVRCVRSDFNYHNYVQRVKMNKIKRKKDGK